MLLQASLGLRIDGRRCEVHVDHPSLPVGIESLSILDLSVGDGSLALAFKRVDEGVVVVPDGLAAGNRQVLVHSD